MTNELTQARESNRQALAIALVIAFVFLIVEVVGAVLTNSLALLADAGHMLSDVLAVSIALVAIWMANRPASAQRTFGYQRAEVLAAAANGTILLLVAAYVFWQAAQRFGDPPDVQSGPMLVVGAAGLIANIVSALILQGRQSESLNVRGAFYHVLGDLAGSIGVIVAGAFRLLRESLTVLLETVPSHIDTAEVGQALTTTNGVAGLHDLHIWTVTSGLVALSCHCELTGDRDPDQVLAELCDMLHQRFEIQHVTIQPEVKRLHTAGVDHSLPRCTSEIGHEHRPAEVTAPTDT